ncbi:MAG: preprotein translocase subunit YajC [Parachlamydiales bacterium]
MNKKMTWLLTGLFCCLQLSLFAEAPVDDTPVSDQGMYQTFTMLALAVAFFYFILWRPEQKRRKAAEEQRSSLKQGDRVNAMGIIGTIIRVNDNSVIVKMYDGSKLEFVKGAISETLPSTEGEVKSNGDVAKEE